MRMALSLVSSNHSYVWAYKAKILAWLQHWNPSNHLSFNAKLSELYAKTSLKVVLEQGATGPII
jgi:hypothetical protein